MLYKDKVLLALPNQTELVLINSGKSQSVSKGDDITAKFSGLLINIMDRLRMDETGLL